MDRQTVEFAISGMTCAGCVRRVENAVSQVHGVVSTQVNLATERATVKFAPSSDQPIAIVLESIKKAGYQATLIIDGESALSSIPTHEAKLEDLRSELVFSTVLTVPIFIIAMVPMVWPPMMNQMMRWLPMNSWNWILLALTIPVQFWIGRKFYVLGWQSVRALAPDMNSLVMIGTTAAFVYSLLVTVVPSIIPVQARHVYFESVAVVITLVLLGKYLETRARGHAVASMRTLLELKPKFARVVREGNVFEIEVDAVKVNDVLEVRPGDTIPVDGTVVSGTTFIDESAITGEPMPVSKSVGDPVTGGTINRNGSIQFEAKWVGSQTTLSRIVAFVESAQASKPAVQNLADRIVAYFVPVVLLIAAACAIGWLLLDREHGLENALVHAVAVLIIACPCAMGLAVPTSIMVGTGKAAQIGILFRSGQALQSLHEVKTVAMDKTGTITEGKPRLLELIPTDASTDRYLLLAKLALVQGKSEHPLAKAIVAASKQEPRKTGLAVFRFKAESGFGVEAQLSNGSTVNIGSDIYMKNLGIPIAKTISKDSQTIEKVVDPGQSIFYAAIDQTLVAELIVSDAIKTSSVEAIRSLQRSGLRVAMITGDRQSTAEFVAAQVGIPQDSIFAQTAPEQKGSVIARLKAIDGKVAFVGDGINDAPALSIADVGVAIGTGTDLAIETSDVILMSGDLMGLPKAIALSRAVMTNIKQNLAWAFGYNLVLIPLAAGVLLPAAGLSLSPVTAAIAMSLSSFCVVMNALRLRRWSWSNP
jgi:P-type Cu+ transporter